VQAQAREAIGQRRLLPLPDGHIEIARVKVADGEIEVRGDYADDGEGAAVERERFAEDVWAGVEFARPQSSADDDQRAATDLVFAGRKQSAQDRLDTENGKEIGRDIIAWRSLCISHPGKREAALMSNGERGEGLVVPLPIAKVWIGNGALGKVGFALVNGDKLTGIRKRKRIQQHAVDDGEQRSVCADAERQREDRDESESRILAQDADAVSDVVPQFIE
jgi:hypothetical protein